MTALWVLALIALLLILLMLLPVGLKVRYDDAGTTVKVQIGWIRFSVFPRKPKQNQKKKRKKKELSQPTQPPEKKESMHGIRDFQPFIRLALDFLGTLRQKIVVRSLTLHIRSTRSGTSSMIRSAEVVAGSAMGRIRTVPSLTIKNAMGEMVTPAPVPPP